MKKRHEEWLRLTGPLGKPRSELAETPIRIIDLPDFRRMEDKIWLHSPTRGEVGPELEEFAELLSERTFGLRKRDTLFELPDGFWAMPEGSREREAIEDSYSEHEDSIETAEATDDEAVEILLKLGLDFRDARGHPLRCTRLFCRQAEMAAKGIKGKVPDRGEVDVAIWETALVREAERFVSRKSKSRTGN